MAYATASLKAVEYVLGVYWVICTIKHLNMDFLEKQILSDQTLRLDYCPLSNPSNRYYVRMQSQLPPDFPLEIRKLHCASTRGNP